LVTEVTSTRRVSDIMSAMSEGRVRPLFDAMAEDVTWRWMGVKQWTRSFNGKQTVVDTLFGGNAETLSPSSSVEVHCIHADGDFVIAEHSGRNKLPDGRRYDNNYCWVFRFQNGLIQEVREYMDTQLVTETFGEEAVPVACPIDQPTPGTHGHSRRRDTPAHLGISRLTRCANRPSKQRVTARYARGVTEPRRVLTDWDYGARHLVGAY